MNSIFAQGGEKCRVLAFTLYSEDHNDIRTLDRIFHVRTDLKTMLD